jgi:glycosyltransferase involved in cell wall biosynthesis
VALRAARSPRGAAEEVPTITAPRLTVVVSTFDRPEALTYALRSLARQTFRDWTALVIGDCCDDRTEAAVTALSDIRLRYFNLPERCGDQSGPNTIGASLCRSPFLAFLNHDDLLLPDHFECLLDLLARTGADFGLGRTLRVDGEPDALADPEPRFAAAPMRPLSVLRCFAPPSAHVYEPVSAWVIRTSAYRRVGEWRDGFDLHRTPFNDWLLRSCRARLTSCVADRPTVVYVLSHNAFCGEGGVYRANASVQRFLDRRLESTTPEEFRAWATRRGPGSRLTRVRSRLRWYLTHFGSRPGFFVGMGLGRAFRPFLPAVLAPFAALYLRTGLDAYTGFYRLFGRRRGSWKTWMLAYRTRTEGLRRADRRVLLEAARARLGDGS